VGKAVVNRPQSRRFAAHCAFNLRGASGLRLLWHRFDGQAENEAGLLYFLHHQHLDGFAARLEFESERVKGLVHIIPISVFNVGCFAI